MENENLQTVYVKTVTEAGLLAAFLVKKGWWFQFSERHMYPRGYAFTFAHSIKPKELPEAAHVYFSLDVMKGAHS